MHLFFSTPVWTNKISGFEEVNNDILKYILELKKLDPEGLKKSNFSGWHSKDFNLNNEQPKKLIKWHMENMKVLQALI